MNDEFPLMAFIANEGVAPKGERYDRSSLVNDTAGKLYKKTRFGDFIYSSNNLETGSIGLNKYGNASVSPVYSIFEATGIADSDFIGRRLVRKDFINAMIKWRQGVVYGQWKIHESDFVKIEVAVPSVDEQRQIGEFLHTLDQQITLHQRKLDKLKNVKQAYLSEMFPAEGERVPKRRFPGFTDDWELRKLGELGTFKNGMNFSKDAMGTGFPFINLQNIFGKNVVDISQLGLAMASSIQLKNYNLQKGDVLFVRSSVKLEGVGETAIVPKNLEDTTYSGFIIRYRDSFGMDINFKRYTFGTNNIRNQIMSQATDSANKNISQQVLAELDILVPSLPEQEAIGNFFSTLDQHITLHQRKLEKLKNLKKALLNELFV